MNYMIPILMLCSLFSVELNSMYSTFFRPTFWREKPRLDRINMTTYELTYAYTRASKSFNKKGEKVPLLAFSNPEPLLPCFIQPQIRCQENCKNNTPIGYAIFDGKFQETTVGTRLIQNIHKNFFLRLNMYMTNAVLKNISITPTNSSGDAIKPTKEIDDYIEKLSAKIFPNSSNQQTASVLGPTFLLFGFMKSFENFNHLDLLDFEFSTGVIMPVRELGCQDGINIYPRLTLSTFRIPFQLKFLIGAYDWFNFGFSGVLVAHLQKDGMFDINQNPYQNNLIIPTQKMASMYPYPFVACTTYIEGEYFLPHWTWYIGFDFTKQYKTVWDICGGTEEENRIANEYSTVPAWHAGVIRLASEFDFSSKEKKLMPRFRLTYVKRLFGKNCFDSSVIAGHFGFEILYDF